jgi:tetratricopeptide (TPR) repeat protein
LSGCAAKATPKSAAVAPKPAPIVAISAANGGPNLSHLSSRADEIAAILNPKTSLRDIADAIIGLKEYNERIYADASGLDAAFCAGIARSGSQSYQRCLLERRRLIRIESKKCEAGENHAVCYAKSSDKDGKPYSSSTAGIIYSKDENKYYIFDEGLGIRNKAVEYFRAKLPKSYVVGSKGRALFDATVSDKDELQLEEVEKGRFVVRAANGLGSSEYNSSLEAYNYALVLYGEGNAKEAIEHFGEAIKGEPKFAKAYNGRGDAYIKLGDAAKALADYAQAIKIDPNYAEAYINRGYAHYKLGARDKMSADYAQAIKIDRKSAGAIKVDPFDLTTYYIRGDIYFNTLDWRKDAIDDFTKIVEINPKDAKAYNARGLAYSHDTEDRVEKAIADFTRAIEINPKYAEAYINRGHAYSWLSKYYAYRGDRKEVANKAIADFTQAIKINPKYAEAYYYRAHAYKLAPSERYTTEDGHSDRRLARKDANKAIADFTQAIKIDPKYAEAIASRGEVYSYIEEYGKAIADFTQAIKIDPKEADYYCDRAWAYKGQQNWKQAAKDARFAVELNSWQRCKAFDWLKEKGLLRD